MTLGRSRCEVWGGRAARGDEARKLLLQPCDTEVVSHVDQRPLRRHREAIEGWEDTSETLEKLAVHPVGRSLRRIARRQDEVGNLDTPVQGHAFRLRVVVLVF